MTESQHSERNLSTSNGTHVYLLSLFPGHLLNTGYVKSSNLFTGGRKIKKDYMHLAWATFIECSSVWITNAKYVDNKIAKVMLNHIVISMRN